MTEGRTDPMTDKFISIEGITKRFAAPGGGSLVIGIIGMLLDQILARITRLVTFPE